MTINKWELILTKSSLKIKNDSFEKEYKLLLYMHGKEIAGVGDSPAKSYDAKYPVPLQR